MSVLVPVLLQPPTACGKWDIDGLESDLFDCGAPGANIRLEDYVTPVPDFTQFSQSVYMASPVNIVAAGSTKVNCTAVANNAGKTTTLTADLPAGVSRPTTCTLPVQASFTIPDVNTPRRHRAHRTT